MKEAGKLVNQREMAMDRIRKTIHAFDKIHLLIRFSQRHTCVSTALACSRNASRDPLDSMFPANCVVHSLVCYNSRLPLASRSQYNLNDRYRRMFYQPKEVESARYILRSGQVVFCPDPMLSSPHHEPFDRV